MADLLRRGSLLAALAPLLLGTAVSPGAAETSSLSPSEQRGREIYTNGSSPSSAPIIAYFGRERIELPGEAATCGSCHGPDGKGRPESGLRPYNITWTYLMKPYGHLHPDGLEHPSFDGASLRDYLRTGDYPGGRRGDPSMPVYRISDRDLDDLLAYLTRVGTILDPGLTRSAIKVGTLVPAEGPLGEIGAAIREVLEARFREVNASGGIYGRRLELAVHEIPVRDEAAPEALARWLAAERPFALVSPFTPRMDLEALSLVSREGIPVIGPFSLYSVRSYASNRSVFHLYPGLGEELEALLQFADARLPLSAPRLAVLYPDESSLADVIVAVEEAAREHGWPPVRRAPFAAGHFDAPAWVERLRAEGVGVLAFLGMEQELRSLLHASAERAWRPWVLAAGALAGATLFDIPPGFESRLYLAYPTLPQDRKPWALEELSRILEENPLARAHPQAVVSAYSASVVLIEALRRAGRDLGRDELTTELEKFYNFETGLTPPVTFTANRRVGASGAYVLGPASLEEGRLPESVAWVEVP